MAIQLNATGEAIGATANLLNYNAAYTWMAWFYIISQPDAAVCLFALTDGDATSGIANYDFFGIQSSSQFYIETAIGGSLADSTPQPTFTTGFNNWFHFAAVRTDASNVIPYENGTALTAPPSQNISARTAGALNICGALNAAFPYPVNGYVDQLYQYDAALTQQEIANQMYRSFPQRTANLRRFTPSPNSTQRSKDYSGNGYDWVEAGTPTFIDGYSRLVGSPSIWLPRSAAPPEIYAASPLGLLMTNY